MDFLPQNSWKAQNISQSLSNDQQRRNIIVFDNIDAVKNLKYPYKIDFVLSVVCTKGQLTLTVDLTEKTIPANPLMVLRPGHTISGYTVSPDFEGFFIVVTLGALNGALPSLSRILPTVMHFLNDSVIPLSANELETQKQLHIMLMNKIRNNDHPFKEKIIQSLCEAIFYETLSIYTALMDSTPGTSIERKDEILYRFLSLVESNFHKHRDVTFYAQQMCISPKHMSSIVKAVSGRTASEWIDSYVILEAKLLLRNTAMTVQEISAMLNFPDASFFGKYFRRLTGTTPRKFRLIREYSEK
jgi:AraC-like DNA-binding protein